MAQERRNWIKKQQVGTVRAAPKPRSGATEARFTGTKEQAQSAWGVRGMEEEVRYCH